MSNQQKFNEIIRKVLNIDKSKISDETAPGSIDSWDSLNHLVLISELENAFDISFDIQDIQEMKSIGSIKNILKKYGVDI